MERLDLFKKESSESIEEIRTDIPIPPLSPMKRGEEIEQVLSQYEDSDLKLIALAKIMKKDRKKMKSINQALVKEIEK